MIVLIAPCRKIATILTISCNVTLFVSSIGFPFSYQEFPPTVDPQESNESQIPDVLPPPESVIQDSNSAAPAQNSATQDAHTLDQSIDELMRGPLHEAFAEVYQENPTPGEVIPEQPPDPIEELPPEYKPEGNNVVWIPGYWAWDDQDQRFIWISGVWRDIPPGQRWVPGYWQAVDGGFRWVSGFWTAADREELDYLPMPPQSIEIGPTYLAPSDEHFYVPGCWIYQNNVYRWRTGYWQPRRANWIYVPGRYFWTPHGCVYRPAYWDREVSHRGVVFAPIYFTRPIYHRVHYRYRPSCVIHTNYDFLVHLFVRGHRDCYYFGDWYGARHYGRNYFAWFDVHRHRRYYDPLCSYYRHSSLRHHHSSLWQWLDHQHRYYTDHQICRPRHTYREQLNHYNQFQVRHAYYDYARRASYGHHIHDYAKHQTSRHPLHRLTSNDHQTIRAKIQPITELRRERQRRESMSPTESVNDIPRKRIVSGVDPILNQNRRTREDAASNKLKLPAVTHPRTRVTPSTSPSSVTTKDNRQHAGSGGRASDRDSLRSNVAQQKIEHMRKAQSSSRSRGADTPAATPDRRATQSRAAQNLARVLQQQQERQREVLERSDRYSQPSLNQGKTPAPESKRARPNGLPQTPQERSQERRGQSKPSDSQRPRLADRTGVQRPSAPSSQPAIQNRGTVRPTRDGARTPGTNNGGRNDSLRAGNPRSTTSRPTQPANAGRQSQIRLNQSKQTRPTQQTPSRQQPAHARSRQQEQERLNQQSQTQAKINRQTQARAKKQVQERLDQQSHLRLGQQSQDRLRQQSQAQARINEQVRARAQQQAQARLNQQAQARTRQQAQARLKQQSQAQINEQVRARAQQQAQAQARLNQQAQARARQQAQSRLKQQSQSRQTRPDDRSSRPSAPRGAANQARQRSTSQSARSGGARQGSRSSSGTQNSRGSGQSQGNRGGRKKR